MLERVWREGKAPTWWECKLMKPLWNTIRRIPRKLKLELPYDPAIPFLVIYPDNPTIWKDTCSPMFMLLLSHFSRVQLCDPMDGSPPGSSVPGILQARTLEWVASAFSNAWKWKVKVKLLSRVRLLATPWTAAYQAPLSMGFSRQEYWSGVPLPSLKRA